MSRLLNEGGVAGHYSHFTDEEDYSFQDASDLIKAMESGKVVQDATEKIDGINLFLTYKDGNTLAARNKKHIQDMGAEAMDASAIDEKYTDSNMSHVKQAYKETLKDFDKALDALPETSKKTFEDGKVWFNVEVVKPETANSIEYGVMPFITIHEAVRIDEDGKETKEPQKVKDFMKAIIRDGQNDQDTFQIRSTDSLQLDVDSKKLQKQDFSKFQKALSQFVRENGFQMNHTLLDFKETKIIEELERLELEHDQKIPTEAKDDIVDRATQYQASSYNLNRLKGDIEDADFRKVIKDFIQGSGGFIKELVAPLDRIILSASSQLLSSITGFISDHNPELVKKNINQKLEDISQKVLDSKDDKLNDKLNYELDRLNSVTSELIPTEGIVFNFKGKDIKLTGSFAPLNQILGLKYRMD